MLFFYDSYGNHSNILFQTIHFESWCLENKNRLINFAISPFSKYYGIRKIPFPHFFIKILQCLKKIKIIKEFQYDNEEKAYQPIAPVKTCIIAGWYFRQHDLILKYKTFFQKKYSLKPKFYKNNFLYKRINQLDKKKSLLIGVHIRKGDYKFWQNGKFYFEDKVYLDNINKLSELIKSQKVMGGGEKKIYNPIFIIFSNEPIAKCFTELENAIISNEDWYIDQFIMSQCDYLIGPPSTFTGWASYIGNVPLKYIESKNIDFTLEDFKIYES